MDSCLLYSQFENLVHTVNKLQKDVQSIKNMVEIQRHLIEDLRYRLDRLPINRELDDILNKKNFLKNLR